MNVNIAIQKRRSVRKFLDKKISSQDVEKILKSAIWAPSGLNNQPWKFLILEEQQNNKKSQLANLTKYKDVILQAPVLICVFLDKNRVYNREKDIMAIGACIQNMLLSAYELGFGSCWLGEILNKKHEAEKLLNTGNDCELMAIVCIGYANENYNPGRKDLNAFLL